MAIEPVGGSDKIASIHEQVRKTYETAALQPLGANVQKNGEAVSVSFKHASITMGKLGSLNEEKNLMARTVRETSEALDSASGIIGGMEQQLGKIIKNNPPFPQESEERKEILMSYVSLRKMIIDLTVPPPPEALAEKNTSLWEKLGATGKGTMASSVPEISSTATDTQVLEASKKLGEVGSAVATARKELVGFVME